MSEKDNPKDEEKTNQDGLYGITEAPKEHPENEKGNLKIIMESF